MLTKSTAASAIPSTVLAAQRLGHVQQVRHAWMTQGLSAVKNAIFGGKSKKELGRDRVAGNLDDPTERKRLAQEMQASQNQGKGSIFEEEMSSTAPSQEEGGAMEQQPAVKTKESMAFVTDPNPRARVRWQRKKVIQMVHKRGELTKQERLKMTEREYTHKSKFLPTSVKKLVMLSRQIAGKTLDEAITQMQWSKKSIAREIKWYLEEARDSAIASRGMGLGRANDEVLHEPLKIQTKEGKWIQIWDPTRMYVAQSWVGRGPWRGKRMDIKGRGRFGIIKNPATSRCPFPALV